MTRYVIRTHSDNWSFLSSLSKFDICDTLPELQNEFCTLWNEIVLEERKKLWSGYGIDVLGEIRDVYVALHQDTDGVLTIPDASRTISYPVPHWLNFHPLCVIASHHPNSTIPSATRHVDPHDPSLHSPSSETQTIGSTAPHHVEEADIISGLLSSTINIPHPRRFPSPSPSPSPTTSSVDIDPQGYAVTDPTFHGHIEAAAPNPNRPVPPEAPHYSHQSSLSTSDITEAIVPFDELTPVIPMTEMGETSQIPTRTLHTFPRPDLIPVTSLSYFPVRNPSDVPDVTEHITAPLTLSHLPDSDNQQDIAAPL